ncbi:MAG: penicillin acylase family protein, partial [Myxococcota bacterium]
MTTRPFYLTSVLLLLAAACGDDAVSLDGGSDGDVEAAIDQGQEMNVEMTTDAEIDAGPAQVLEDLPVDESLDVLSEHLTDVVNAVRDELGMWHIYGANLRDVFVVQGFLQARDRAGQMELIRRSAMGRLAEFGGALDPGLVDDDQAARFAGHARNAAAIFATLTVEEQDLILAHTEGINVYMEQIRDSTVRSPSVLLARSLFTDWSPVEVLSIARLQAASLSFDGEDDARNSENLAAWQENFPVDGAPELVARAGAFHDLFPFQPSPRVYNRDGFPNVDEDTGSRAIPAPRRPGPNVRAPLASLRAATDHFARMEAHYRSIFGGDEFRGSNSWVVSGEHTVSGFPLMANDPHLGLTSPPLFWQAHLNTARAGGDVNTAGQMIAGTPVNLLGFNEDIAWGLTTSGYDVTDVYMEQITPGEGGAPDTVLFNGAQVPIEIVNEEIAVSGQDEPTVLELELVPHHGFIVPGSREDTPDGIRALSVAWTGNAPSNELGAFLGLYTASTADEAREAFRLFEVGGQTLVMATRAGDIDYTSSVLIPIRPPAARTYNPATYDGVSPCFVLDGTGVHEWERDGEGNIVGVDERFIPHDRNPDKGFIATANADPVGVTDDGDPHNDAAFIGCNFAAGHRLARVDERLRELVAGDAITPADMSALQNDAISPHGRLITETLVRELGRALEERD